MLASSTNYPPLALPFLLALAILFVIVVTLIELRVLRYAYERIGIGRRYFYSLLMLSLLGSYVNIPITQLPPEEVLSQREISMFGVRYVVPQIEEAPGTIIAVNLGGAVIPTLLSFYLLFKHRLYLPSLVGVAIVAAIVHLVARPVRGVGIAIPTLMPPLVAAAVALVTWRLMAPWRDRPAEAGDSPDPRRRLGAAPLAYIVGTMGTLIGAYLMNLGQIQGLGAPVASIGGAGTFDGVFLTGILAVLLA